MLEHLGQNSNNHLHSGMAICKQLGLLGMLIF